MKYAAMPVLLMVVALGGCTSSVHDASLHRNVQVVPFCSLVGPNAPASGTEVRISTFFTTDYMERSRLADPACLSAHVDLQFDKKATGPQGSDAYDELESVILHDLATDHRTGVYSIALTGRFVYRKNEQPHAAIYGDQVWSFKRRPCTAFYPAAKCKAMD